MTYIQKSLDELYEKMPVPIPQVKLVQCKYNNDSNLIGALANYKKVYYKRLKRASCFYSADSATDFFKSSIATLILLKVSSLPRI